AYLESLVQKPRHIEFQMLGDSYGNVRSLFERDCSLQRRYEEVIEDSPAPRHDRAEIDTLATRLGNKLAELKYNNIGTIELLYGEDYIAGFLEMNTRLQVEHAITEQVTGVDLVIAQIRCAAGEYLSEVLPDKMSRKGHAIEARVYA